MAQPSYALFVTVQPVIRYVYCSTSDQPKARRYMAKWVDTGLCSWPDISSENGILRSSSNAEGITQAPRLSMESLRGPEKEDSDTSARILVVDDETVVCRALESLLAQAGHQAKSCLSGQEAIAKLRNRSFDLVITDLSMPSIGGLDVLKKGQELDLYCKVIVITGHTPLESVVQVMNLGACDCISKRLNIDEIRVVVDSPYGGAKWYW
jgi:CheY-like chemotaxis protein